MNNGVRNIIFFTCGLIVGVFIGRALPIKDKVVDPDDEITMEDVLEKKYSKKISEQEKAKEISDSFGYSNKEDDKEEVIKINYQKPPIRDVIRPYILTPEEFGEDEDYVKISLTYYQGDGVLVDETNEEVEDVDETVGEDFADHFGEYEDDSVYVRNDARKCEYEILLDYGSYSNVRKTMPHPKED